MKLPNYPHPCSISSWSCNKKSRPDTIHLAVSKPTIYSGVLYTLNNLILVKEFQQNQLSVYFKTFYNIYLPVDADETWCIDNHILKLFLYNDEARDL